MVAVEYNSSDVAKSRREIRSLARPGQKRVHFKTESNASRKGFLRIVREQAPRAFVFSSELRSEPDARIECLQAICGHILESPTNCLIIERDASKELSDRHVLTEGLRNADPHLNWEIQSPHAEPLLWVPDAIAWCWTHPQKQWNEEVADLFAGKISL